MCSHQLVIDEWLRQMTRALRGVDLESATERLNAYEAAGIPSEQIRDFDQRAVSLARVDRQVNESKNAAKAAKDDVRNWSL